MSFLGRQTGERAMQGVGMHQQQHVGARVSAGEAGAGAFRLDADAELCATAQVPASADRRPRCSTNGSKSLSL
jgi:hypothetical protein